MDPSSHFTRQQETLEPSVTRESGLVGSLGPRNVEEFRPRTREDYAENGMSVSETTIALRKEELLRILISGKKTRQAAEIMRLGINTVRTYIRCPEFQMKLWNHDHKLWSRIDEELRQAKLSTLVRIQEMSEIALERIEELMSSEDENIQLRASQDVLDRNPETSKRTKQDTTNLNIQIDPAQLMLAAQAAREMEVRARGNSINSGTVLDGGGTAQSE